MSPESTMAPPTSQRRIDANRRNAQKSSGPRTPEGKSRSRFNRLKHGLAATVAVLPGEDPDAFQARVDAVMESFVPHNQVEYELLERVASTTWSFERARRAEAAQLSHKIRHDVIERVQREKEEAVALGQRLFLDARGPWQLYPHTGRTRRNTASSVSGSENSADPNNPALLILRLEHTVGGCRWLLDRWAELWARLEPGEVWAAPDQFKAIRLLGKQPLDAVDDPEVAQIYTASFKLLPEIPHRDNAFTPLTSELESAFDEDDVYDKELKKRPLATLTPPDADAARAVLRALVDRHTSRLKLILLRNQEIAEADAAEAPNRLGFDCSPEGDKLRRYVLSAARLVNQTLNTFLKVRKGLEDFSVGDEYLSGVGGPSSVENSSVGRWPLPGANQEDPSAPALNAGCGLDQNPRTEPNLESSVVRCPAFVVNHDNQKAPRPSAGRDLDRVLRTEPNMVPDESSNNRLRITGDGQSPENPRTEPNLDSSVVRSSLSVANDDAANAPGVGHGSPGNRMVTSQGAPGGLLPGLRTEPNPAPDESFTNGPRTTDKGQSPEANPAPEVLSGNGHQSMDRKQQAIKRTPLWREIKAARAAARQPLRQA